MASTRGVGGLERISDSNGVSLPLAACFKGGETLEPDRRPVDLGEIVSMFRLGR